MSKVEQTYVTEQENQPLNSSEDFGQLLNNLNDLTEVMFISERSDALDQILQIGNQITGAPLLAIYQADSLTPQLKLLAGYGPTHLLPEFLPPQELILLNTPQCWISSKRSTTVLQRAIRATDLPNLISAPIGQPQAFVGLFLFAGARIPDEKFTLPIAKILANSIGNIFQIQAHKSQSSAHNRQVQTALRIASMMEERANEGLILLTPSLQIVRINTHAEMLLGYANREVSGQPVENVLIGSETLAPALSAAQQGGVTYNLGNLRLYRRSGEDFLSLARVFPVMEGDQVINILIFFQDLSEQEHFRIQAQQLEQRAILGEVTAIFAHEVRNPINNISTGLQFMSMNLPEDDPNQESLKRMLQDCDRLAELIKSVLSFSRPTEYAMEPVDLSILLRRLMERLHPRIARLNIHYQLHIQPDCPPVRGNLRALEQIFSNLINNALQAMGEQGGRLAIKAQTVQVSAGRHFVEISVADTGPGIPVNIQERIFQPFFTTERNGTGLGLAITKRIVTAHKGTIRLESFPGGTVFYVQIPIAQNEI